MDQKSESRPASLADWLLARELKPPKLNVGCLNGTGEDDGMPQFTTGVSDWVPVRPVDVPRPANEGTYDGAMLVVVSLRATFDGRRLAESFVGLPFLTICWRGRSKATGQLWGPVPSENRKGNTERVRVCVCWFLSFLFVVCCLLCGCV